MINQSSSYIVPSLVKEEQDSTTTPKNLEKIDSEHSIQLEHLEGLKSTDSFRSKRSNSLTKLNEESCCTKTIYDLWDLGCYIIIKIVPCLGRVPIFRSCRAGHAPMKVRIEAAHVGLSVTYDDYTGMINTILLVAALFLSFVSATLTVCADDQYLKADLEHCRRGWASADTCIDLDAAGYFGDYNATGLLDQTNQATSADARRLSEAISNTAPGWMQPVTLNRLSCKFLSTTCRRRRNYYF